MTEAPFLKVTGNGLMITPRSPMVVYCFRSLTPIGRTSDRIVVPMRSVRRADLSSVRRAA
jgi:hypothetical protein